MRETDFLVVFIHYFSGERKSCSSYQIQTISSYKDSNTKVVYCLSWVIRQNVIRLLATSSENLVASTQFLVALANIESQFQALRFSGSLLKQNIPLWSSKMEHQLLDKQERR